MKHPHSKHLSFWSRGHPPQMLHRSVRTSSLTNVAFPVKAFLMMALPSFIKFFAISIADGNASLSTQSCSCGQISSVILSSTFVYVVWLAEFSRKNIFPNNPPTVFLGQYIQI